MSFDRGVYYSVEYDMLDMTNKEINQWGYDAREDGKGLDIVFVV